MAMTKQRNRKLRQLKQSIYIVCEGTNTERIYFEEIAQQKDVFDKYAITVYPSEEEQKKSKTGGLTIYTDAVNLVKLAQKEIDNYDEVWAVFDKNGYTKHQEVFSTANKRTKKVNIAFSSIAFEHWILLHYEKNQTGFLKSQEISDYLNSQGYFLNYSKKANISVYLKIQDQTQTAIENAAWLRREMAKNLAACGDKIYELNPYVTVDKLVMKLLDMNPVTYGYIKETLRISDISITVNDVRRHNGITLSSRIVNHGKNPYLVNNNSDDFYLIDEDKNNFPLCIDAPMLIEPSFTQDIDLIFSSSNATGKFELKLSRNKEILIILLDNVNKI